MFTVRTALTAMLALACVTNAAPAHAADTTAPKVSLHAGLFFKVGTVLDTNGNVPANITWKASDDVGITSQDAYWRSYYVDSPSPNDQGESHNVSVRQFVGLTFIPDTWSELDGDVTVYDAAGSSSSDVKGYQGDLVQSGAMTASTGWTSASCSCWSGGMTLKTTTVGATLRYQFYGSSVAVVGDKASGRGSFQVSIDGVNVGSAVSEAGTTKNRVILAQKRFASNQSHVIKIVAKSGRVDIDAIVYSYSLS